MLAIQEKTNQKLRDLEIARDEARSLLYASLTTRDGRNPELLQKLKQALLEQIREQIQQVVKAPSEAQSIVLEETSTDIADKVASSQAALENVRRVSAQQLLHISPSAERHIDLDSAPNGLPLRYKERSDEVATLVGSARKKNVDERPTVPEVYLSARSSTSRKIPWGNRFAALLSPTRSQALSRGGGCSRSPKSTLCEDISPPRDSLEHVILKVNMTSLSCVGWMRG